MNLRPLFLAILLVLPGLLFGQPGNPNGGGDVDAPITGIEILVALGGVLGIKRLLGKKSKNP